MCGYTVITSMFLSRRNPELISVVSRNPEWIPSSQLKSQIRTRDQSRVHPEAKIPFTRLRCMPALSETEEMRVDFIFVLYCDEQFICSYSNNNYVQMLCTLLVSAFYTVTYTELKSVLTTVLDMLLYLTRCLSLCLLVWNKRVVSSFSCLFYVALALVLVLECADGVVA